MRISDWSSDVCSSDLVDWKINEAVCPRIGPGIVDVGANLTIADCRSQVRGRAVSREVDAVRCHFHPEIDPDLFGKAFELFGTPRHEHAVYRPARHFPGQRGTNALGCPRDQNPRTVSLLTLLRRSLHWLCHGIGTAQCADRVCQ